MDRTLLGTRGDLVTTDLPAIRRLAVRMSSARPAGEPSPGAGEIAALGLLHEVGHLVIARYEATRQPGAMRAAVDTIRGRLGSDADLVLDRFATEFPGRGSRVEPAPIRLEELLLTRISNENPAIGAVRELVDDRALERETRYREAIAGLEMAFAGEPSVEPGGLSVLDLLREPARHSPTSLAGQLRYIREHWTGFLGDDLVSLIDRLDVAVGVLTEDEQALHRRFGGGGGDPQSSAQAPSFAAIADEPEAFSTDSAWMPSLVLIAKSTYVWLDQLSRQYGRDIRTLNAIPDEELDMLRHWGVTGLWLIGLWQRSQASERIKRMRGNAEAVASAYSLDDYRIADDLGGEEAYANLRDRAWARGIRLASDMVPNHMGIDSRWVIDHPEWFLSLPEPPYPSYTFASADLSSDPGVGIVLEDHYWDDSDAAVVFKRFDRWSGETRYIYHGNDGTSFPWNDTAQLDFLDPGVREHVIQTIVAVARRFPVIRFDAAMVLAKRHIERLWWPEPGHAGGIPSRAEHAIPKAEFDARMPLEFWREVVDRVAAEAPGTLLLAEAFWMLEGYFVRTLGMHRVYNSAFMHMFRDEDGPSYRRLIKETLEFDPEILKRYVNFMSNPDEKTALEQFGKGDKYVGVAMVMATLPGLPMLGHGQVQGFGEKYGMEFRRANQQETPDPSLLERHERELFPLLHRRAWFAEARDFLLYDLVTADGSVDEHVFAYSNGSGPERSLVLYHVRFASTRGTIRESAAYAVKAPDGSRRQVRRTLADGLGLPNDPAAFVAFRDARTGLESIRSCREIWEHGLAVSLDAYGGHVFWEFRELHDGSAGQWGRLAARLGEQAVPSLDEALRELQLEPIHGPLRAVFEDGLVIAALDGEVVPGDPRLDELERRFAVFLAAIASATGVPGDPGVLAATIRAELTTAFEAVRSNLGWADRTVLLSWLALGRIGALAPGADVAATSRAWFGELRLAGPLAAGLRSTGLDERGAWSVADEVQVLLTIARPSTMGGPARTADARLIDAWLANDLVRAAIGVNGWEGVDYLDRDRFARWLTWAERLDAIDGAPASTGAASRGPRLQARLSAVAEAASYRLDAIVAALRPVAPASRGAPAKPVAAKAAKPAAKT